MWPDDIWPASQSTQLFNFARSGATTSRSFIDSAVPAFDDQINTFYSTFPTKAAKSDRVVDWTSENSLFVVWIGVNVSYTSYSHSHTAY